MKLRSPAAVLLLPLITFGIYTLVWEVKTKNEMNAVNSFRIPTAWLLIVPIANFFWLWNYASGAAEFTRGTVSRGGAFWLMLLLGTIGGAIVQSGFNTAIKNGTTLDSAPAAAVPVAA